MSGFQQSPMNGVGSVAPIMDNIMNTNTQANPQEKVINAVNKLMQVDSDFPTNIEKLAKLASEKPAIYQMAVNYLNNL
jgi:hypothetical protein